MALSYVGGTTSTFAGAASGTQTISLTALTGGVASAPAARDIVIVVYASGSTANRNLTMSTAGYTNEATLYSNGSSYDTNLDVWWKIMGTTPDTSAIVSATGNNADAGAVAVHVWRGVDGNSPLDATTTTITGIGTGRPDPPAITPVTTGAIVIAAGGAAAATGAVFIAAGLSNFRTATSADTNDAMVGIGSFAWTSGTYNPAQWTGGTTTNTNSWAAATLALRPASDPSGTLAATETGSDTFAATGDVVVKGSLAATETGSDTFAATGKVIVEGSLAATEGQDTFDSQGTVTSTIVGDLHGFESIDTFSSSGTVLVRGSLAATETKDTFSSSGKVIVRGSLSATETGNDSFTAIGTVLIHGDLDVHETGADAFTSTGKVVVKGSLATSETGLDVFDSQGSVTGAIVGDLHATETGADSLASTGKVIVSGSLAATEITDTFTASGKVYVSGALSAAETGDDIFDAQGDTIGAIVGDLHATETGSDTLSSTGKVIVQGTATFVETGSDTADILGVVTDPAVTGAMTAVETDPDTFSASGVLPISGSLDASEFDDIFYAYESAPVNIWDTEQGVAKGYAKFTPMQDAEPFLSEQKVESAVGNVIPQSEATAPALFEKLYASYSTVLNIKANGYAPVDTSPNSLTYELVQAQASGTSKVFMFHIDNRTQEVVPECSAAAYGYVDTCQCDSGYTFPYGVRNPSDAEIITLILESRKRRHLTQKQYDGITRA